MRSEAIPLQSRYHVPPKFPGGPGLVGRIPAGGYNYNSSMMAVNYCMNQERRNQGYIQQPSIVPLNSKRTVVNDNAHFQRKPKYDMYLAGTNPNHEVPMYQQRPRQRDRSSPPDSYSSELSRSSSDGSGENRFKSNGQTKSNQNSFRPSCRQKSTAIPTSDTPQQMPQEKNSKLRHKVSQRRTRNCCENKPVDHDASKTQNQALGYSQPATAAPRKAPITGADRSKPSIPNRDHDVLSRQGRRMNRKSNGHSHSPTSNPVNCTPMQAIENEMTTRKSRPRRLKRSEAVRSNGSCETVKQKKSFSEMYEVQNVIGVGGGGVVYAGTRIEDNYSVAVKLVPRDKVKRWEKIKHRTVPQEIALMMRVNDHPGVVKLLDWCENTDTFIFVLERPKNSIDLFDYIRENGKLKEKEACKIFKQIVSAVEYIHFRGVVHRDIKDENIVLDRVTGEAKVIDFGCGTLFHDHYYKDFAGTPEFYPPEWFNQHCYRAEPAATWSLGVLLYGMICGEIPFKTKQAISQAKLQFKQGAISTSARKLITWLLQKDPEARPCIEEIYNHPWLKSFKNS